VVVGQKTERSQHWAMESDPNFNGLQLMARQYLAKVLRKSKYHVQPNKLM